MKTCSCMSTWPRSTVATAPRTVSMWGMRRRYAGIPPMSAGKVEETREVVAHHRLDLLIAEVLELTEIRVRFGQSFSVREVGAEHNRLDAHRFDDAVDVLLGERCHEAVLLEVVARSHRERAP